MALIAGHIGRPNLTPAWGDVLLFVTARGEGLDYNHWRQRVWLPALKAAGVEGLTFHDLRRANATALVAEHVDIKTAQTRLGHADPRTTLGIYAGATGEGDRQAAEAVARRLTAGTPHGRHASWHPARAIKSTPLAMCHRCAMATGRRGLHPL